MHLLYNCKRFLCIFDITIDSFSNNTHSINYHPIYLFVIIELLINVSGNDHVPD